MIFRITNSSFHLLGGKPTGEIEIKSSQHEFESENHLRGSLRRYLADRETICMEVLTIEKWDDNAGWVEIPLFVAEEIAAYQRKFDTFVNANTYPTEENKKAAVEARNFYKQNWPDLV